MAEAANRSERPPRTQSPQRRQELLVFLFLSVVLAPVLAVIIVGGYGFAVWMSQLLFGPPTG